MRRVGLIVGRLWRRSVFGKLLVLFSGCMIVSLCGAIVSPSTPAPQPTADVRGTVNAAVNATVEARSIEPTNTLAPTATRAQVTTATPRPTLAPLPSETPPNGTLVMRTMVAAQTESANAVATSLAAAASKPSATLPAVNTVTRAPAIAPLVAQPATPIPTARPAPTAIPPTAVPQQTGPVYTNEGGSRVRVDPSWYPCEVNQVKGNRNSGIYHAPGQRDYAYTFKNVACFDSEAQAVGAGFRRALR